MSIQAVSWVLDNSKSKSTARLVLIALANRCGREDGECWPTMRTIAREAGVASTSTVTAAIDRLVVLGELEIVEKGNQRRSGRYRLPFAVTNGRSLRCSSPEHSEEGFCSAQGEHTRSAQGEQNRKEPSEDQEIRAGASRAAPFEDDFNKTWRHYPRKEARKAALKQYQARRRDGADPAELHLATQRYARLCQLTGRVQMLGSTFYGPNERWKDFLDFDAAMAREAETRRSGSGRPEPASASAKAFVCVAGNPACVNGMVPDGDDVRPCECQTEASP